MKELSKELMETPTANRGEIPKEIALLPTTPLADLVRVIRAIAGYCCQRLVDHTLADFTSAQVQLKPNVFNKE